jgi:hypothetical protein
MSSSNVFRHAWPHAALRASSSGLAARGSRPPGGALGRFGEVAALRRGSGTKAASPLAPGRCCLHRIVTDRELARAVGQCTEHRPEQDE